MSSFTLNSPLTPCGLSQKQNTPIYQRLFIWDEEQIDKLLSDLKTAAASPANPYSVGIVSVVEDKGNDAWVVTEGQQQLTFLTLFGAECIRRGVDKASWKQFVFLGDGLRISYVGRPEDQEDIWFWVNGGDDLKKIKNPNIHKFHECFEKIARSMGTVIHPTLSEYSKYVYENTSVLVSAVATCNSANEVNKFFAKMLEERRQLEPEDIIKGKYFPDYTKNWNACMNFLEKSVDQGPVLSILKPAVFLLHVLRLTGDCCGDKKLSEVSLDPNKLVQTFDAVFKADFKWCFMEKMKTYRAWLDENIILLRYGDGEGMECFLRRKDGENEDLEARKLKQFQSMLYVSSSEQQEWVLAAFLKQQKSNKEISLADLKEQNKKGDPADIEKMKYPDVDQYCLRYLDYLLWESFIGLADKQGLFQGVFLNKKEQAAISNYRFQRNRSIEHLHPQCSNKSWADPDLHGFGNLALLSTQSNEGSATKLGWVKAQLKSGNLESIKMLLMFKIAELKKRWTPSDARIHGTAMLAILEKGEVEASEGEIFLPKCRVFTPSTIRKGHGALPGEGI